MTSYPKFQKLKKDFLVIVSIISCLCSISDAYAQEKAKKIDPQTVAEYEAMKTEWEKVRDQQIEMIREKEEDLDRLKEELFKRVREGNITDLPKMLSETEVDPEVMAKSEMAEAAADPRVIEGFETKIEELKEANRKLSAELSSAKIRIRQLEAAHGAVSSDSDREDLQKERQELEEQKALFKKERQKFFDEMSKRESLKEDSEEADEDVSARE